MKLRLTLVTAQEPAIISKSFTRAETGTLVKHTGGRLVTGTCQTLTCSLQEFCAGLNSLKPNQAFVYGVCEHATARIVPQAKLQSTKTSDRPVIARDREHFDWSNEPGVGMLDYDPEPGRPPLSRDDLFEILYSVWPALKEAPHVWAASASSCIHDSDTGEELRGLMGQRVYIPVQDARDIPRAGAVLFARLWLAGHGRFDVSKSGASLDRGIIDTSAWQPERLDFAGGAACGPGLEQRRPEPILFNGEAPFLDSRESLPDLSNEEKRTVQELKTDAQKAKRPEVAQRRAEWIAERTETALKEIPEDQCEAARTRLEDKFKRAVSEKRLLADFTLHSEKHGPVTVGELLSNPDKWDGKRFADPLEPDYGNDERIAVVNLRSGGRPYLFSHAHGGQRFSLHRSLQTIRIEGGELPQNTNSALELVRINGEVYDRGGELVRIAAGRIYPVTPEWLTLHLSGLARFEKFDKRSGEWRGIDCPPTLAKTIYSMAGLWNVPRLTGLITAPTITPEGRVIESDGYDQQTCIYLDFPDAAKWPGVHQKPTDKLVEACVERLWHPFREFPFVGPKSRGVHLAALLTANVRPLLPTAPGTGYTAPSPGSGKTLLALCVAALGGQDPVVMPPTEDDAELRKRLLAVAREGTRSVILDNVSGMFKSDALCALLTSSTYSDRVLGATNTISIPTAFNVLVTGNCLTIVGDLNRRLMRCEIDPRVEQPFLRAFDLDPLTFVRDNRLELVHAALTILRAFVCDTQFQRKRLASFDAWSELVRGAVCWIGGKGFLEVADPVETIVEACTTDPDLQKLNVLLHVWRETFGGAGGTVPEAIKKAKDDPEGALSTALEEIAGDHGRVNPRRLGRWIEMRTKRIVNDLYFQRGGERGDRVVWTVSEMKQEPAEMGMERGSERFGQFERSAPNVHGKKAVTYSYIDRTDSVQTDQTVRLCDACVNFAPNTMDRQSKPGTCETPYDDKFTKMPTDGANCPRFERVMH